MNAGSLDRKIVIQSQTTTRDDFGGQNITWGTYKTVWANVRYKSQRAKESNESDQLTATRVVEFRIRTLDAPLVDEAMRVSFDSVLYDIEQIQLFGRNQDTLLITNLKV